MNRRAQHTGLWRRFVLRRQEALLTHTSSTVILLVEDDDHLRQLVMKGLEGKQHWVVCARNGEEAWDLFSAHRPLVSLLITEVVLPDMDGLELASRAPQLSCPPPSSLHGRRGPAVRGRTSGCGKYQQLLPDEALRS